MSRSMTTPGGQKRSSPYSSSVVQVNEKHQQLAIVTESKSTPSPIKRLRRPLGLNGDEVPEEHFHLRSHSRSPYKGSQWSAADRRLAEKQFHEVNLYQPGMDLSCNLDPGALDDDSLRCTYKCRNMVKSEVLAMLNLREKQVLELNAELESVKAAHTATDGEKKNLKKQVNGLDQGLAAAKARETSLYKTRTKESDASGELVRTHIARCIELEARLQEEMTKHAEAEARALALEGRAAAAEDARDKEIQSAVREANKLNQELERAQMDSLFSLARVNAELEVERAQAQGAAAESDRLCQQLKQVQENASENLAERLKLEHQIFDADIQTSLTQRVGPTEAELVIKHLKEELSQCEAEVRDARKQNQRYVNVELLKEHLASEKDRAERAEAALSNMTDLEAKVQELEVELSLWKEMIVTLPGVETRDDVKVKFAELQRDLISLNSKLGESNAQIVELQTALALAQSSKHQAEIGADTAQAEALDAALNLKRAERKMSLLAKERDGLKAILSSYDEEEHVIASHQKNLSSGFSNLATPEKAKELRIQQLEQALADAQQQAKVLGEEVEKSMGASTEQRHRAENLSLMLADAEERYKSIDREAGQLRSEISVLESKLGRGQSDASTTKVLHMIINPEAEVHGHTEVEALRARLEQHERSFDGRREEGVAAGSGIDKEKVAVLTQRVTALEKREARYKQVFANKISIFREACGLIFGYKVQMNEEQDSGTGTSVTLFTLQSIYAASEDEHIQFQFKTGTLEMIANEYTSSPEIHRQVITFVRNYKSVPAFIANLTMEQFNKTTLG